MAGQSGSWYPRWLSVVVFVGSALVVGATVAGPGLSWDEPAYRHSQVAVQIWAKELTRAPSWSEVAELFSQEQLGQYWQYEVGSNFHPPMAGYLNLATFAVMRHWWDDISARRLASALQFALAGGALVPLARAALWSGRGTVC